MNSECFYSVVSDSQLNEVLSGRDIVASVAWPKRGVLPRLSPGHTGVVWRRLGPVERPVQPLALVARDEDFRRLCGRFAQLRSDLSPLTSWCYLLSPQQFDSLDSLDREPQLAKFTAAWAGLVVAEALLLAERPLAQIRISACLATLSFAIARCRALWSYVPLNDAVRRFDTANRIIRRENGFQKADSRNTRVRAALQTIWTSLIAASDSEPGFVDSDLQPVVACLHALHEARARKSSNESYELFARVSTIIPEAEDLKHLETIPPELRLRMFDKLVDTLGRTDPARDPLRRNLLSMLAGYLATVAAGGAPSLSLAETNAQRWPEITAWAYVLGSIGESVIWTSSFDGLGRLVARELTRPLRFDDPPSCDFALDEGIVLVDPKLPDPLVHLRVKQARIATVALLPGVNVAVAIAESDIIKPEPPRYTKPTESPETAKRDPIAVLADALWPHLRDKVKGAFEQWDRPKSKKKSSSQPPLPMSDPPK